jgi:hypothetical protein
MNCVESMNPSKKKKKKKKKKIPNLSSSARKERRVAKGNSQCSRSFGTSPPSLFDYHAMLAFIKQKPEGGRQKHKKTRMLLFLTMFMLAD